MPKPRRAQSLPPDEPVPILIPRELGGVKSAARVLEIFELFSELRREARLGEVARRLDYPQSSTSVLLKNLVTLGYLQFDEETKSYIPSPRIALLGQWIAQGPFRDGALTRLMDDLNARTGHTIALGARNGIFSQYIQVIQGTTAIRIHLPTGSRRLLAWSSVGFILLARESVDEIGSLIRRSNAERPDGQPPIDAAQVFARIEQARRQGYIFSRGLVTPGAGLIAMSVQREMADSYPVVLCVAGWLEQLDRDEAMLVSMMKQGVARYLGACPASPCYTD